jgi:type I restriction-modification system DNA methylase subunit
MTQFLFYNNSKHFFHKSKKKSNQAMKKDKVKKKTRTVQFFVDIKNLKFSYLVRQRNLLPVE